MKTKNAKRQEITRADNAQRLLAKLTPAQKDHLKRVESQFLDLVRNKYVAGKIEHGGNLWEKDGIIDKAIEEVVDLVVYLLTLKEQMENTRKFCPACDSNLKQLNETSS